jgi:hypothetical protein
MLDKFIGTLKNVSTNGFSIPITATMLERFILKKSGAQDIKVKITPEHLILRGTMEVKKLMLKKNVSFAITLKPFKLEKRLILLTLVEMKPLNMDFINSKIFNKPPFMEYDNQTVKIDLNAWDIMKKIPLGNIKSYELVDGAMNIKVSK